MSIPLGERPLKMGRDRACQIYIGTQSISREHAEFRPEGDEWMVVDLDSSNGTFVNGSRIETYTLSDGDKVTIGDIVLRYIDESAQPAVVEVEVEGDAAPPAPPADEPQEQAPAAAAPARKAAPRPEVTEGIDARAVEGMRKATEAIRREVGKIIVGQTDVLDQVLAAMLARGHCLMVGVPGLAKTLIVSTISKILDLDFTRVQFTPDLMPSDITGPDILEV
ncbi:FHA domain-containing protein, partial [bacterium]|nr:FHA domain-containing protein [bacterium]